MSVFREGRWTELFSSTLFCLWLSTASLIVWFDMSSDAKPAVAANATDQQTSQP